MYLKELRIWNFRQYGTKGENNEEPGIVINFHKTFNLLIGENDAGKTTILDAIRHTLGTFGGDSYRISDDDFHINNEGVQTNEILIECDFSDITDTEAGLLLEWLTFDRFNNYELTIRLRAKNINNELTGNRVDKTINAGPPNSDSRLDASAINLIRTTYLKPLRDAESELKPGLKSRLAQILKNHVAFNNVATGEQHELEKIVHEANEKIEKYFDKPYIQDQEKTIRSELINYLDYFFHIPTGGKKNYSPNFKVSKAKINNILKRLSLDLDDKVSGLGSLNLLFIATELLLHNNEERPGASITLIEEVEAHLHPQAQLRLIKFLQNNDNNDSLKGQFILSTHSTTLTSSTKLEHIILINDRQAFPMGSQYTQLALDDYKFLERFLDSTKANLFFAKGIIFVEGDAENLLLPLISEIIDRPLYRYGVSIVNIGNTAFKRYSRIFSRSDSWLAKGRPNLTLPVAIITDVDVRPFSYYKDKGKDKEYHIIKDTTDLEKISHVYQEVQIDEIRDLIGKVFTSYSSFKKTLEEYIVCVGDCNYLYNEFLCDLNQDAIVKVRESKEEIIKSEFNLLSDNISIFVAPHWTLEYELALSSISKYLAIVIHNLRYKHPNNHTNYQKLENILQRIDAKENREEVAYEIFKPLNDKRISKAIAAQELAEALKEKKSELKSIIEKDPYLSYLIQAIYHVTEPVTED